LIVPAPPAVTNDVPVTADIRDLKPLADIPDPWFWVWVAAGVLAAALAGWLLWRWWKASQAKAAQPVFVPPHVRARQRLNHALDLIADAKPFCTEVSDTVRVYLEEQFNLRAPERTTEEFLRELQESWLLSNAQKKLLGEFLEQCDLVKFARFEPMQSELESLHRSACQLVEETRPDAGPEIRNPKSEIRNPA
jgi:hypothetical protein